MAKFADQFLSINSLALKYDYSSKTIRRYLFMAQRAGLKIEKRKMFGGTRYSEKDFDEAMQQLAKQKKLNL